MAGMDGLGRVFDVVFTPLDNPINMANASAVSLIVKATSTTTTALVVQAAQTFAGTPQDWTTANGYGQPGYFYQNTKNDGTGAWTKQTLTWTSNSAAVGATAGYVSVVTLYTSQFAPGYKYLYVETLTNLTGFAVLHDLTVQRKPANLTILSA